MSTSYRKPWDFFISYASEDRASAANPLANALTRRGFSGVWLDHQVLDKADRLEKQIELGLTLHLATAGGVGRSRRCEGKRRADSAATRPTDRLGPQSVGIS